MRKANRTPRARHFVAKWRHTGKNELEEIVHAIRRGGVDALVTAGAKGDQVVVLQGTEHPYRLLVEAINDGAATLDSAGAVLYANDRFAEILGVPDKKLVGAPLQAHVPSRESGNLKKLIASARRGKNISGEILLDRAGGSTRTVRFAFSPVRDSGASNICVVVTDLTDLAKANEAVKSNEESLRQLSARLLQLQDEERRHIARDLHDITGQKLAVQSITLSQLLNRESAGFDGESRRMLVECAALTKQVSDEIRTLSYVLHPPLLDEMGLSSAVKWYAEGFEARTGISIEVNIASDFLRLPPEVEVTLFRVIQESLTNVHRYSKSPRAYIRVESSSDEIKVRIGDFGKGMPPRTLNSITGASAPMGVGIQGMKERMRQLSGRLEITSRPKEGTLVTAILPMSRMRPKEPQAPSASSKEVRTEGRKPRDGSRKRILIADDHEMLRRGVRTMLQEETDWEVCGEAVDGKDAIDKTRSLNPDLVILDINLPVMNGLDAMRRILRDCPQTKILAFTVDDSNELVKEIKAAGAHGWLSKNRAGQDLVRTVKELLAGKGQRSLGATRG